MFIAGYVNEEVNSGVNGYKVLNLTNEKVVLLAVSKGVCSCSTNLTKVGLEFFLLNKQYCIVFSHRHDIAINGKMTTETKLLERAR